MLTSTREEVTRLKEVNRQQRDQICRLRSLNDSLAWWSRLLSIRLISDTLI